LLSDDLHVSTISLNCAWGETVTNRYALGVVGGAALLCATIALPDTPVKMADLPSAVQATVKEQSKRGVLRGLSKEVEKGKTTYEAELRVNGHSKDVSIDANGNVVEVEEETPIDAVPVAAKAAILKGAGTGKILKVESVTQHGSVIAYEAAIQKIAGGKKSEVRVSPDGKPAPEE
jgi:hypothetical protein